MSGLMHKVKDALTGEKDTPAATAANQGKNEYGHHHTATEHGAGTHGNETADPLTSGAMKFNKNDMVGRTGDSTGRDNTSASTNAGPHSSNLANKADPRVDSDLDSSRYGTGSGTGTTGTNYGRTTGTSTTAGPHSSNLANKADPRVDSDLDSGHRHGTGTTGSGLTGTGASSTGYGSSGPGHATTGSTTAGPHSSNIANKADPRVDSNLDSGRNTSGLTGSGAEAGTGIATSHHTGRSDYGRTADSGTTGYDTTGGGMTGSGTSGYGDSSYDNPRSANAGPHSSSLANKADPRVDSDLDSNRNMAGTTGATGATGTAGSGMGGSGITGGTSTGRHGHHSGATGKVEDLVHGGPHHTETANRLDPHVSGSGIGNVGLEHASTHSHGSGTTSGIGSTTGTGVTGMSSGHGSGTGTGTGTGMMGTTAGPHSSNVGNKMDPRVDSDMDGSRNMGAHSTTSGLGSTLAGGYGSSTGTSGTGPTSGYGSTTGSGMTGNTGGYGSHTTGTGASGTGPTTGYGTTTGSGTTGNTGGYGSHTTGTGATGTTGAYGGNTTGQSYDTSTGPAAGTAGPHKSNLMNKLDPRVDSDRDGKTTK
ncbi:MAG: hypothetical protein Q9190_001688 [Brigantiaea leucoxantha]